MINRRWDAGTIRVLIVVLPAIGISGLAQAEKISRPSACEEPTVRISEPTGESGGAASVPDEWSPQEAREARRGCCSRHGGVCGFGGGYRSVLVRQ